ncbi:AbrB/MazE/SpoVT family DNA-binding domain-containing protein [bacterium]|nr:AbrB/MazE/SpoVT family DNA-binding domain-containing protein [bacterium]
MKTSIDSAGRVVIPKSIRSQAGLGTGQVIEISFRDGAILIEPALAEVRLERRGEWVVAVTDHEDAPLTTGQVKDVIQEIRNPT